MKKILILLFLSISSLAYSQTITTLSCVDKDDPKFQMVVKFNSLTRQILDPLPIDYELNVSDDLISFKRKTDKTSVYTTIIYRNTGQYTIFGEIKGNSYVWSGTCSKVTQNKF